MWILRKLKPKRIYRIATALECKPVDAGIDSSADDILVDLSIEDMKIRMGVDGEYMPLSQKELKESFIYITKDPTSDEPRKLIIGKGNKKAGGIRIGSDTRYSAKDGVPIIYRYYGQIYVAYVAGDQSFTIPTPSEVSWCSPQYVKLRPKKNFTKENIFSIDTKYIKDFGRYTTRDYKLITKKECRD